MEKSKQELHVQESRRTLLSGIHRELALAYPIIKSLEGYSGFKDFRLYSFKSLTTSDNDVIFTHHCEDRDRGLSIKSSAPMIAEYMAIAQEGGYRKRISTQLVQNGLVDLSNILGGWRTPAYTTMVNAARETILLGLDNDSLVIDLNVFSPRLKSLEI